MSTTGGEDGAASAGEGSSAAAGAQGAAAAGSASAGAGAAGAGDSAAGDAGGTAGSAGAGNGQAGTQAGQGSTGSDGNTGDGATAADWRKDLSGGDEKLAKMLERYTTAGDAIKAFHSLRTELSSGKYRKAEPPKDATPEQLTAWRSENGLPTEAKGYFEKLPDGLVIGEDDMPIFESFGQKLLEANLDPRAAHIAVDWYNNFQKEELAKVAQMDAANAKSTEDTLRKEWGGDYDVNSNLRAQLLATAPKEVAEAFKTARLPDGTLLGERPEISRWLVAQAREINPTATIMPNSLGTLQTVEAEIADLQKMMKNDGGEYWKGPKAQIHQTRFRELLAAREKLKARAA